MLLREIVPTEPPAELQLRLEHIWKLCNPAEPAKFFALGTLWTDSEGSRIQGDTLRSFAADVEKRISVGSIYTIAAYTLRSSRPTYRGCLFPHWLDLTPTTTFLLQPPSIGATFKPESYESVPFSRFPHRITPGFPFLTDFIEKIVADGSPNYVDRGATPAPVQTVNVVDGSGLEIEVSLWSDLSTVLDADTILLDDVSNPVIVAFLGFQMRSFKGKTTAASGLASRVVQNPQHPAAESLRLLFAGQERSITYIVPKFDSPEKLQRHVQESYRTISELNAMYIAAGDSEPCYRCTAKILAVDRRHPWYYRACPQCSSAVAANGAVFWCSKHDTVLPLDVVFRYRLQLLVSDRTTETTFVLLGHTADRIMPIPAADLARAYPDDYGELPPPLQIMIGQEVTFGVHLPRNVRLNTYGDCTISKIWGLNMPRAQLLAQMPPPPLANRSPSPPTRHDTPLPPDPAYVYPVPSYENTSAPSADSHHDPPPDHSAPAPRLAPACENKTKGKSPQPRLHAKTVLAKKKPASHVTPPKTPNARRSQPSVVPPAITPCGQENHTAGQTSDGVAEDYHVPLSTFRRNKKKAPQKLVAPEPSDTLVPSTSIEFPIIGSPSALSAYPLAHVKQEKLAAATTRPDPQRHDTLPDTTALLVGNDAPQSTLSARIQPAETQLLAPHSLPIAPSPIVLGTPAHGSPFANPAILPAPVKKEKLSCMPGGPSQQPSIHPPPAGPCTRRRLFTP